MPTITLTAAFVANELTCPEGKPRIEYCDADLPGLYLEVRATSLGQGTYYLRYKDAAGKTCHQKIARTTHIGLAEARKRARELKAEIQLGADPRGELKASKAVPTLTEFFDDAYTRYAKPRKRSFVRDEQLFRLRIKPAFGHRRLNEINRREVQNFHADLLEEGLAPASADHHIKLIRQMLNRAVEWEVIPTNPVARIKLINADNRIEVKLDGEDLARLLKVLDTDENRTVCNVALLLLATGARLNEALSATYAQIDRQNRVWKIPASVSKSKRVRSVPLTDAAMDVLDRLETKEGYLFVSPKTKEKIGHVHKVWDRLRTEAGLPTLRIHDLRHSFASMLVNSGHSLYAVQQLLGHSTHSVTERYAHLSSRSLMDAANSASLAIRAAMTAPQELPGELTHSTDPSPVAAPGEVLPAAEVRRAA